MLLVGVMGMVSWGVKRAFAFVVPSSFIKKSFFLGGTIISAVVSNKTIRAGVEQFQYTASSVRLLVTIYLVK